MSNFTNHGSKDGWVLKKSGLGLSFNRRFLSAKQLAVQLFDNDPQQQNGAKVKHSMNVTQLFVRLFFYY
jgi:hypothetical protein